MKKITSLSNPIVKDIKTLHTPGGRIRAKSFIIEGLKFVQEAHRANIKIRLIAIKEGYRPDFLKDINTIDIYEFSESVMKKVSTTETPPGVIAIAEMFEFHEKDILNIESENRLILILENINDPGNLGTIIRTACAAGVTGIILTGESVDLFNPKVIRATAGNLWKIPIIVSKNKQEIINQLHQNHFQVVATDLKAKTTHLDFDYKQDLAILFGSEAHGISEELLAGSDNFIKIPLENKVESLNVAISAAIILFEAVRQRAV
jgi:TrmH family RNA methyltransferase